MVDFTPSNEISLMLQSLDDFHEAEIAPLLEDHRDLLTPDYNRLDPDGRLKDEAVDLVETVRRRSGEAGFYGVTMPESVGGSDVSTVELVQLIMRLYSTGLGLNMHVIEGAPGPHRNLLELNESLQEEYLIPTVEGKQSGCFALTESSSGSDATDMETTAERDGNEWVINGNKMWITNSPYADYGQIFAETDSDAEGARGISAFLFDTDNPGFSVERMNETILNDGMQAEISFNDCRVPDSHLIGEPDEGFYLAMRFLNMGRIRIAARCVGLMSFLQDLVVEYANQRESWGKPIGKRQHVRRMVANIATWKETLESLVLRTAWLIDQGEDPAKQASMAKYYGTEKLFSAGDNAVQVFGANGLTHDYPIQRIFRYARLMRIPEGTSEIQQETIAREVGL
ncbi:acyl-CoA/acyl-ACP dehydrogenase [Natronomonas gomsonensis]|uniref:acyl-CoA dehydrogenase family protein n=1 Tax=Natronomonas gomsonensis TaxID=1046043 RepID=UPI0020CA9B4B|nr:acyl-CoA dehydrogenase family protein [Natronomonas gomsonensis]MCY4729950.1 acyl-CoA/acyl-ACP dehydrogenase [Natronomonas gomsonensis]